MEDFLYHARMFATIAHRKQRRKYTGAPYVSHCFEVFEIVNTVTQDPEVLAAALLHDTLEDVPGCTVELIQHLFGEKVARLVVGLTDVSVPADGNRATRKAMDREHLAKGCEDIHTIKLADLISNTKSIVAEDPKFADVYMPEKILLLPLLSKGSPVLRARAQKICDDWVNAKAIQSSPSAMPAYTQVTMYESFSENLDGIRKGKGTLFPTPEAAGADSTGWAGPYKEGIERQVLRDDKGNIFILSNNLTVSNP